MDSSLQKRLGLTREITAGICRFQIGKSVVGVCAARRFEAVHCIHPLSARM